MSKIAGFAGAESEIEEMVSSVGGTIEQKDAKLRELGVYRRYAEVFSRYIAAFETSPSDLEPLKRATFLAWYELTEPPCFSGVGDLPGDARSRVVQDLDQVASDLDSEFQWMLAYYLEIEPAAFPGLESHQRLRRVLDSADPEGWLRDSSAPDRMKGRGLMGEYWCSVFASGAAKGNKRS